MKLPNDVKKIILHKFQRHHQTWLKGSNDLWPLIINLDVPAEKQVLDQKEGVRSWIAEWRAWESGHSKQDNNSLVWSERNWRILGTQKVPEKLVINKAEEAVLWIGKSKEWNSVVTRYKTIIEKWQVLTDTAAKHYKFFSICNETDFLLLLKVVKWICDNPNSNLYPRQLPVEGIDSKWLESHKRIVSEFVSVIKNEPNDFIKVCGLKTLPQLMRMRILDPHLRNKTGGLCDISIPWEEAEKFDINPSCVFIVENQQSALAFHDLQGSVVIMGLGYGVENLDRLAWLKSVRCIYWGDIDTHGFSILSRARKYLPKLESILMDEATLLEHKNLWVKEEKPCAAAELPNLTHDEQKLYKALKSGIWGQNIRLEQERICWDKAWKIIERGYLHNGGN